jgi:hypothetical protein
MDGLMKPREDSVQVRPTKTIAPLPFVSRAEQLCLRGQRNFSRYHLPNKGFVDPNGPERVQWQRESGQESLRDDEWNRRHGPVPGGARILQWREPEGRLTSNVAEATSMVTR